MKETAFYCRKVLSILLFLSILTLFSADFITVNAFIPPVNDENEDMPLWYQDEDTLYINYDGQMPDFNFPYEAEWFKYGDFNVKKIVIGEKTTTVGNNAFSGYKDLESVILPQGLTSIGEHAFENCTELSIIKIPFTVTEISESAFDLCEKLTIRCIEDSYAGEYAESKGIKYKFLLGNLKLEEDSPYKGSGMILSGVSPDTEYEDFLSHILTAIDIFDNNKLVNSGKICTGYIINTVPMSDKFPNRTFTVAVKGDTDGNGTIDATDYLTVKRHILGISKLDEKIVFFAAPYFAAADIDDNGTIDATDYIAIKRHILGISKL